MSHQGVEWLIQDMRTVLGSIFAKVCDGSPSLSRRLKDHILNISKSRRQSAVDALIHDSLMSTRNSPDTALISSVKDNIINWVCYTCLDDKSNADHQLKVTRKKIEDHRKRPQPIATVPPSPSVAQGEDVTTPSPVITRDVPDDHLIATVFNRLHQYLTTFINSLIDDPITCYRNSSESLIYALHFFLNRRNQPIHLQALALKAGLDIILREIDDKALVSLRLSDLQLIEDSIVLMFGAIAENSTNFDNQKEAILNSLDLLATRSRPSSRILIRK
jgi:hypothetical protein